jgi:hypothetical protein
MQKVFIQTKFSASPSPGSPPLTVIWVLLHWGKLY